jgi:hypothetical protein
MNHGSCVCTVSYVVLLKKLFEMISLNYCSGWNNQYHDHNDQHNGHNNN